MKKKIICTVTNDLNYDQRMMRICSSLQEVGYDVTLVGWQWPSSQPLIDKSFHQHRIPLPWQRGKKMYLLYWVKLFQYLIRQKADVICAIDLDTIIPVFYASKFIKSKRVYDAHEIFSEMQEVNSRPIVKKMWDWIANKYIPQYRKGYTIGDEYARFFKEKYNVDYETIRNATILKPFVVPDKKEKYILYQGAVNVGRCFEQLIPAMKDVNAPLYIVGKGNYQDEVISLISKHDVGNKVVMMGYKRPEDLKKITENAWIGITLFDSSNDGKSNHYSMANRFFDYMHHGVPQLCNDYPEYRKVNEEYGIGILIDNTDPKTISTALNKLLNDEQLHQQLSQGAMKAREQYNWQEEEKKLISFYKKLFTSAPFL